uniref:Dynamin-binding protein n=1 Tax=Romanomermis culicivorax TaxID=13658 RepID=A0A915HVT3_ROMCU
MDYDLLYKAIYEFTTNIQGELPLFVGDVVNDKASPAGIFPSVFVAKLDLSVPLKKFKSIWVASDDFLGQHDGDLNLLRGDFIIDVRRVDADWLEGRSGFNFAKRGIFPANFACQLPPPLLSQKEVIFSRGDRVDGIFIQQDSFGRKHSDVRARVICDLEAKLPGEISLVTGEIVYIESSVDETFFSGRTENGSTHGIFPKRFVEICDDKALLIDYRKLDSMPKDIATTSFNDICSSPKSTRREDHRNNYSSNYSESYGYTKFEFIPQYREELGFKANQKIRLIKHVDHEWILGEICNTKGIFPASYVDIKIDCPWMKVRNNDLKKPEINDSDISKSPTYQAVYDFPGMVEGDLQTATGDFVQLLNKIDDCWIEAKNSRTLKIGMIPLSFLKKCGSDEICFRESNNRTERPASWNCDSSSEQAASSKHSSLKHRVSIPDTALEVQNEIRMKHNEEAEKKKADLRSQRTHIFEEIIHSENDYINDLTICVQIFHESKHQLDVIALLAGFPEIIALSKKLVQTLDEEHEKDFVYQEIGNAFLNLQVEFKDVYADFCQTHESTQKLLDDNNALHVFYGALTYQKRYEKCL